MCNKKLKIKLGKRLAILLTVAMLIVSVFQQPLSSTATETHLPEEIYSDGAGFITTYGMRDKRINELVFAEAHNAHTNNVDGTGYHAREVHGTQNHDISILKMLQYGYRIIDIDIGYDPNGTRSYHRYRLSGHTHFIGNAPDDDDLDDNGHVFEVDIAGLYGIVPAIHEFLHDNENEIVIISISEVYNGTIEPAKLKHYAQIIKDNSLGDYSRKINDFFQAMEKLDMVKNVFNYEGSIPVVDTSEIYSSVWFPGKNGRDWPLLREMIDSDKRILFVESQEGFYDNIPFTVGGDNPHDTNFGTLDMFALSNNVAVNTDTGLNKLYKLSLTRDNGFDAGDENSSYTNNRGERIYDMIKRIQDSLSPIVKGAINYVSVDFANTNNRVEPNAWAEISPIDAVNRANYDRLGYTWSQEAVGDHYWNNYTKHQGDILKSYKVGGTGGSAFSTGDGAKVPIKVTIKGGDRVDSITVLYDDLTSFSTGGGGGHTTQELVLGNGEYITEIALVGQRLSTVKSMIIKTNQGNSIKVGNDYDDGEYQYLTVPENYAITGFFGRSADKIDSIGAYARPVSKLRDRSEIYSQTVGGFGGSPFLILDDAPVDSVIIRSANRVDNVQFIYNNAVSEYAGGNGGSANTLVMLYPNEYIKSMDISTNGDKIHYIQFTTSTGRSMQGGTIVDDVSTYTAPDGWYIGGLHGRAGDEIDRLGVIYKQLQ